jgi:hypothetical protein
MAGIDTEAARYSATLELISTPKGWAGEVFLLPVSAFPVPDVELTEIRRILRLLNSEIYGSGDLNCEVFIQMAHLHVGDGGARLSRNARYWMPQMGLGVWPDREPPALYTPEEIQNVKQDEKPRTLMHQVFRVSAPAPAPDKALDAMLGLGTLIQIAANETWDDFRARTTEVLLPPIEEPTFRFFPYYVPLLDKHSVVSVKSGDLQRSLCGATVYIRESAEDKGILVVSVAPLTPILEKLGAKLSTEPKVCWQFLRK